MSDIMKDKTEQEQVDLEAIDRANQERLKVRLFNKQIIEYLKANKLTIDKVSKEDVERMTAKLTEQDKYVFIKQVVK